MTTHTQCVLERNGSTQVSWIETKFATEGRYLELKENGEWVNGWRVKEVYSGTQDSNLIQERSADYRKHRQATDV